MFLAVTKTTAWVDSDKKQLELGRWRIILAKISNDNVCDKKLLELGKWRILLIKIINKVAYSLFLFLMCHIPRWRRSDHPSKLQKKGT